MPNISIEVDELPPYLRRTGTNEIVQTSIERISPAWAGVRDWEFDWTRPGRFGYQVFALKVDGDDRMARVDCHEA